MISVVGGSVVGGSVMVGGAWLAVGLVAAGVVRGSGRRAALARARGAGDTGRYVAGPQDGPPTVAVSWRGALMGRWSGRATRQELIVLIDELSAALASGGSSTQAMVAASRLPGPLAADLARGVQQAHHGRGAQEVIDAWARGHQEVGAMLVADALALADSTGGSRTRALAGVRSTLREADGLATEIRALSAQSRLSATVLTLVPVGFAAVVAVADSRIASFLLATPVGWACLIGGGVLDAMGAWWMRRLTDSIR